MRKCCGYKRQASHSRKSRKETRRAREQSDLVCHATRRGPTRRLLMDKPVTLEPVAVVDKKAEKERKKADLAAKRAAKKAGKEAAAGQVDVASLSLGDVSTPGSSAKLTSEQRRVAANRAVTGVLASMPAARDIKFASFSVSVGGRQLVADSNLELTQGCRYGLLGDNGSGKSNVLAAVAQREVPLPEHVSVYHLHEEAPPTELSGVEAVIEHVRAEVEMLKAVSEARHECERRLFTPLAVTRSSGSRPCRRRSSRRSGQRTRGSRRSTTG